MLIKLTPDANDGGGSSKPSNDDKPDEGLLAILQKVAKDSNVKDEDSSPTPEGDSDDESEDESDGLDDPIIKTDDNKSDATEDDAEQELDKAKEKVDGKEGPADEKKSSDEDKAKEKKAESEKPQPLTDEEIERLPFNKHKRFQQLVKERKEAFETVERTRPLAAQAETLNTYCRTNGIAPKQLQEALEFVALINSNPAEAAKRLDPIMQQLQSFTGDRLPADLAAEVEEAKLTPERAKEIAQLRSAKTFDANRSAQTAQQQFVNSAFQAAEAWETQKKTADPDYASKRELVNDRLNRLLTDPKNEIKAVSDITALLERAYTEITKETRRFSPAPTRRKNLSSNGSSSSAKAEPKSFEEAVMAAGKSA